MGNGNSKRGDAYLNAYSPTVATCPWIPVIGNHEANDGDNTNRYLNLTYGETLGGDDLDSQVDIFTSHGVSSTAESALTELLSKTTLLGVVSHSGVPSGTSRYFSMNVGLIHFANIDLNVGPPFLSRLLSHTSLVRTYADSFVLLATQHDSIAERHQDR